ncbi:ABC transporter permease [Clostridium chrysemydis]|uniref:ABC transporter permease n=1 Tax=Clostridium chrysemydis TaxID=2665504 RepID=UPI003F30C528
MIGIIKSVVLKAIREPKYLIFTAIFPIFLTILLGNVLKNGFSSNIEKDEEKSLYILESEKENQTIDILSEVIKNENLDYKIKYVKNIEEGKDLAREKDGVLLDVNDKKVDIYTKSSNNFFYKELKTVLENIKNRSTVINLAYKSDINLRGEIASNKENIKLNVLEIEGGVKQTSFDYYGIVEITMMCLYIMLFPVNKLDEDRKRGIYNRGRLSGMSNLNYYAGNIIGNFIISFLVTMPAFLFNLFILKINLGNNPFLIYLGIEIFALAVISIGVVISSLLKEREKIMTIVEGAVFPVFSFLGGAYIALPDNLGGFFQILTNISPLRWLNRGIFNFIYLEKTDILLVSIISNIAIFLVCLSIIAVFCLRREDRI